MKKIGYSISRTWDGKNKETTKFNSIMMWFFSFQVGLMWRGFNDMPCKSIQLIWNRKRFTNLFIVGYDSTLRQDKRPEGFFFQSEVTQKIGQLIKRTLNWSKIRKLEKEIDRLRETCHEICSDPMNGCPEDFAEDYNRRISKLEYKLEKLYY